MSLQIIDCEQNSPEWFAARAGMPTASEFSTILAKGRDGKSESVGRRTYMLKLAGEILTGEPMESYSNAHMERGKAMEDEARNIYAFMKDVEPERIGFAVNGSKGASPDSFIGDKGGLEIKTGLPHIVISALLKNEFPPEHKAQVQGCMWVCEREWWDCVLYWPKLPPLIVRATRDDLYIADMAKAVEAFNAELRETVERIRAFDRREAA